MSMNAIALKERDVLRTCREYLKYCGWYVIRHQAGMGSHPGLSDIQALKDGVTIYIETKATGGKLSPNQEKFRDAIESHGGIYFEIRSVEELEDRLSELYEKGIIREHEISLLR